MRIAIVSDIHDHVWNLRAALDRLARGGDGAGTGAAALVCCGDLCSPFVVDELARGFPGGPVYVVFGNNDGDRYRIADKARGHPSHPAIEVRGESAVLELGGRRVFVHHFDDVGRLAAAAGAHDLVCYGHDHERRVRREPGAALEVNPGPIMGWHPRLGEVRPTYAVYDTEAGTAGIYDARTGEPVAD